MPRKDGAVWPKVQQCDVGSGTLLCSQQGGDPKLPLLWGPIPPLSEFYFAHLLSLCSLHHLAPSEGLGAREATKAVKNISPSEPARENSILGGSLGGGNGSQLFLPSLCGPKMTVLWRKHVFPAPSCLWCEKTAFVHTQTDGVWPRGRMEGGAELLFLEDRIVMLAGININANLASSVGL